MEKKFVNIVKALIKNNIPVMGHLGLLPHNQIKLLNLKGKKNSERNKIFNDAKLLESAGAICNCI